MNQPAQPQAPMQTGKSSDPFKMWAVIFVLLFLAAAAFAAWQTLQLSSQSTKVAGLEASVTELQSGKIALQAELDGLKGGDTSTSSTGSTGDTTNPDTTKILAAVDAYVRAPVAATEGKFEYSLRTNNGTFAKVDVTPNDGSGYLLWLKKVDDNWTVLFGGQDTPADSEVTKYAIPESLLR